MPRKAGDTNDRWWAEAIRRAVSLEMPHPQTGEKTKKLRLLADRLVDEALNGDVAAMKEIGDRLDGKPKQAAEVTGAGGGPLTLEIVRTIVDPSPR